MNMLLNILVVAVAVEHTFIMILEMFFIRSSTAERAFGMDRKLLDIKEVRVMFANQGLYNGFLAAGLYWSLFAPIAFELQLKLFFICCVIVAAVYGTFTANKKIILTQGSLAILAMLVLLIEAVS